MSRGTLRATAFLTQELQLELPMLALHRSPFGSAMVTSVGMFKRPVVVGDGVEPRLTLPITATIDHRCVDGGHVSRAMTAFREYLAAPDDFEPNRSNTGSTEVRTHRLVMASASKH